MSATLTRLVVPARTAAAAAAAAPWRHPRRTLLPGVTALTRRGTASSSSSWYHDFDPQAYRQRRQGYNERLEHVAKTKKQPLEPVVAKDQPYRRNINLDNTPVDEELIQQLLAQRDKARSSKEYETADAVLHTLINDHGVQVYDNTRTWRSGARPRKRRQPRDNDDDDDNQLGHDYTPCPVAGPNTSGWTEEKIHQFMAKRTACRRRGNFKEADNIQQQLIDVGVYMQDETRQWRADGRMFGRHYTGTQPLRQPYRPSHKDATTAALDDEQQQAIQELVDQRSRAKLERKFDVADGLREELQKKYDVYINDKLREWCVGKMP